MLSIKMKEKRRAELQLRQSLQLLNSKSKLKVELLPVVLLQPKDWMRRNVQLSAATAT